MTTARCMMNTPMPLCLSIECYSHVLFYRRLRNKTLQRFLSWRVACFVCVSWKTLQARPSVVHTDIVLHSWRKTIRSEALNFLNILQNWDRSEVLTPNWHYIFNHLWYNKYEASQLCQTVSSLCFCQKKQQRNNSRMIKKKIPHCCQYWTNQVHVLFLFPTNQWVTEWISWYLQHYEVSQSQTTYNSRA